MVVHNFGGECQRFYLFHHKLFNDRLKEYPYSPYHMSDYSFEEDKIYLGTRSRYFAILTANKKKSFIGDQEIIIMPVWASSHMMENASLVWLLGGKHLFSKVEDGHETMIIDLRQHFHKYSKHQLIINHLLRGWANTCRLINRCLQLNILETCDILLSYRAAIFLGRYYGIAIRYFLPSPQQRFFTCNARADVVVIVLLGATKFKKSLYSQVATYYITMLLQLPTH